MFIASQILVAISTVILITYSVMEVKRETILICNIAINLLLAFHYALLQSYTGAICTGIIALMVFTFYFKNKVCRNIQILMFIFFLFLLIISGILTWEDVWSAVSVIGNILLAVALWNNNEKIIKALFIIIGILWIALNIHLKSTVAIIGQILSVSSNVINRQIVTHLFNQSFEAFIIVIIQSRLILLRSYRLFFSFRRGTHNSVSLQFLRLRYYRTYICILRICDYNSRSLVKRYVQYYKMNFLMIQTKTSHLP